MLSLKKGRAKQREGFCFLSTQTCARWADAGRTWKSRGRLFSDSAFCRGEDFLAVLRRKEEVKYQHSSCSVKFIPRLQMNLRHTKVLSCELTHSLMRSAVLNGFCLLSAEDWTNSSLTVADPLHSVCVLCQRCRRTIC